MNTLFTKKPQSEGMRLAFKPIGTARVTPKAESFIPTTEVNSSLGLLAAESKKQV